MRTNAAHRGLTYLGTAPLRTRGRGSAPAVDLSQLRYDPLFGDDDMGEDLGDFADPYANVDADVDADVPGLDDDDNDAADFGRRLTPAERKRMRQQRIAMRRRQKAQRQALNRKQKAQRQKIRRQTENSGPTGSRWAKTILTAQGGAGQIVGPGATLTFTTALTLRPQFNFKAMDLSLDGPAPGDPIGTNITLVSAGLLNLNFGDQQVWSNAVAAPLNVLQATSFIRNLVKGQRIRGGLDIASTLELTVVSTDLGPQPVAANWTATVLGWKQTRGYCP